MKLKINPWPPALFLWFAFLIVVCIGFVIKTSRMNNDLVSKDYYAESRHHDAHQAAIARTKKDGKHPLIKLDTEQHRVIVVLPEIAKGAVLDLYRPSDANMDLKFSLRDDAPSVIPFASLHPGMWQAKISWRHEGLDYFHKEDLFIP